MVCFSWHSLGKWCYSPASSVDEEQGLLSKPIQLVYTWNWYITKTCVMMISLLQNVWVRVTGLSIQCGNAGSGDKTTAWFPRIFRLLDFY